MLVAGRYDLRELLGTGAVGATYRALDALTGDEVAVKVLRRDDAAGRALLIREFLALRGTVHPHIAEVRDLAVSRVDGRRRSCLVSRFVSGVTLDRYASERHAGASREPLAGVLSALACLHARGFVHGDVKASNVLIGAGGRATLIDFGCARPAGSYGDVYGTLDHLSPEALAGEACPEGDIYALGVMLAGLAWRGQWPPAIAALAARFVAKDRADRPTAEAALDALGAGGTPALRGVERASRWVGHDAELRRVELAFDCLARGQTGPRFVEVTGPPSAGRSRFLLELRLRFAPSFDVIEGDAREAYPIEGLLARALGSGEPIRGIAQCLDALERLAQSPAPTVLVLDDADRMGERSFQTFAAVARSLSLEARVALVGAGERSVSDVESLAVTLPRWTRDRVVEWLGDPAPPAGLDRLVELSGGLPKNVVLLVGDRPAALLTPQDVERRRTAIESSNGDAAEPKAEPSDGQAFEAARAAFLDRAPAKGLPAFERLPAAEALEARAAGDPALAHAIAETFQEAGEPERALSVVARALRRRPPGREAARLRALAGACTLRRGDTRRALRRLRRAFEEASAHDRGEVAKDLALALLRSGDPSGATDVIAAVRADGRETAVETRGDLACSRAVAAAYLGRYDQAERALEEAGGLGDLAPRTRVRLESARALLATRRGRVKQAAAAYARALALAEAASVDDLIIQTALNAGTMSHVAGDLGAALRAYERGESMARATSATSARISLGFNRGKLLGDIGSFEHSEAVLQYTRAAAARENMVFFEGVCHQALADGRAARGDLDGAERALARALATLAPLAPERELLEAEILSAEIALARGNGALAERVVALAERAGAPDIAARAHRVCAHALERRKATALAVSAFEHAARLAEESGQTLLVADVASGRARMFAARGAASLAAREESRAREIWEGVALGLPPPLDRLFREHPQRRALLAVAPSPGVLAAASATAGVATATPSEQRASVRLRHLVAINRRIGSAPSADGILDATLDAAIELTRAERGFLLLRGGGDLRVAAARNFDQQRVTRSTTKFSQAVAKRVVAAGEAVIAVDAGSDPRFSSSRSVHALELKSILCVPIAGTQGTVGALYLDFRFRAGAFTEDDVDVVRAFADQAAIALERATLLAELKAKNAALEAERSELARLADGRAQEIEELHHRLAGAEKPARERDYGEIIGRGPAMSRVLDLLDRVVTTDLTVLIEGESGTGKELVARAIHRHGARADKPFLSVNCGALPPALFEGELFGYRKGACTGASKDYAGLFVAAEGGTLLLDELGELPLDLQVKLLRVLQEREVHPLGSPAPVPIDVRILCATHRDLKQRVFDGQFREDLYYRVAVVTIALPPLRERVEDLPELARAVLARAAQALRRPTPMLARSAERALLRHSFPGNVRQLENLLTGALLLGDGEVIHEADLALPGTPFASRPSAARPRGGTPVEAAKFRTALEAVGWNVCEAARALQVPRATFYRKLRRYGLERPI